MENTAETHTSTNVFPRKEDVKVYEGSEKKMDHLNDSNEQQAIILKLRTGDQAATSPSGEEQPRLGFTVKDGRIINLDDPRNIQNLETEEERNQVATMQLVGDKLKVTYKGQDTFYTKDDIKDRDDIIIPLLGKDYGLRLRQFYEATDDPTSRNLEIDIAKKLPEAATPIPIVPPEFNKPEKKKNTRNILIALATGIGLLFNKDPVHTPNIPNYTPDPLTPARQDMPRGMPSKVTYDRDVQLVPNGDDPQPQVDTTPTQPSELPKLGSAGALDDPQYKDITAPTPPQDTKS